MVLLDFGCTIPVPESCGRSLLKLILACRGRADADPLRCFAALGFDPLKLRHISQALPFLCKILFEPFLVNHPLRIDQWNVGARVETLLGESRWWFRSAGPANLFLLLRAFQGLVAQLETLGIALPWWPELERTLGQDRLARARSCQPPLLPAAVAADAKSIGATARALCVRVVVDGRERVGVKMPAEAALDLEEIIPDDVLDQIREAGIDLEAIAARIRASGVAPQELFELHVGEKRYRVWLE